MLKFIHQFLEGSYYFSSSNTSIKFDTVQSTCNVIAGNTGFYVLLMLKPMLETGCFH